MAEYIEREAALAIIGKGWRSKIYADDAIQASLDEIGYRLPAADVAPVRHGRWLPVDELEDAFDCSECDAMVSKRLNYCPKCGAKMDKEEG